MNRLHVKKKIALISTTSTTIKAFMLNHVKKLSDHYNLLILCKDAHLLKKLLPNNVLLIDVNFKRKPNIISDIIIFFLLLYYFLKYKPNMTISISPKAGFITSLSSYFARVSYRIHWYTGQVWITKKGIIRFILKIFDKLIFNLSNHVLVDSFSQKKFLIKKKIISKKKSSVIFNGSVGGVNIKRFKYNNHTRKILRKKLKIFKNDFVFLYLGRINKDKGIIDLLSAFKKIENLFKVFLVLVGPVENNRIKKLIISNKKILHFEYTQFPENWYSFGDILCLPSYREGFGSVIIEAASCNLPSLGSKIYGITDAILDNQTGILHKVGNVRDIRSKMLFAIRNKKLLKSYGKYAKQRVKVNFDENLISKEFVKFIKSRNI